MSEELCAYEMQRLATIQANQKMFEALGLGDAVSSVREMQAPKKAKAPRVKEPISASRSSRRLSGGVPIYEGVDEHDHVLVDDYEDVPVVRKGVSADKVDGMTPQEVSAWCENKREDVLEAVLEELDDVQAKRLRDAQVWLGQFTEFTARFGGQGEVTMSKANVKSVLKRLFLLVSGAGVTCPYRKGAFCEGQPITLGISGDEVDALRVEAQLWCPLKSAPADLIGRSGADGRLIKPKPDSSILDKSNGWTLNHPLVKMRKFCEYLDEVREHGLERTLRRLTTGDADGQVDQPGSSSSVVRRAAEPEGYIAFEDFIVPDGEGEDPVVARTKKAKKVKTAQKPKRAESESPACAMGGGSAEEDVDEDEDAPLSKRLKSGA
jgi:hypothetical protein